MPCIDRRLHGEQAKHTVGALPDFFRSLLAPGPDRRTDVVDRADACALQGALEAKIEIRRVDTDECIRAHGQGALAHGATDAEQARQMTQYFGKTHHRQAFRWKPGIEPCCDHAGTADTGKSRGRMTHAQRVDKSSPEQIPGSFAGDKDEEPGFGMTSRSAVENRESGFGHDFTDPWFSLSKDIRVKKKPECQPTRIPNPESRPSTHQRSL